MNDLKKRFAIQKKNEEIIKKACPNADNRSGIYGFFRYDENGIKYAYLGQAKKLLMRLAQHLSGYQHIDLSIKKHGLYDEIKRPNGWHIEILQFCCEDELDALEKQYILKYAKDYQLRNKTSGSQGEGKTAIDDFRPAKGYREGLKKGYENARKDVAKLFEKLTYSAGNKPMPRQKKALEKFEDFLKYGE